MGCHIGYRDRGYQFEAALRVRCFVKSKRLGQAATAKRLGLTLPRLAELMQGKINVFQLDDLVAMAVTAGMHVELRVADSVGGNVECEIASG